MSDPTNPVLDRVLFSTFDPDRHPKGPDGKFVESQGPGRGLGARPDLHPDAVVTESQGDGFKITTPHGHIDYRPNNGVNEIWWVESHKKGHGSELVDMMQKNHPADVIGWGVTTPDGKGLRDRWHAAHPEVAADNGAFEGQYDPSGNNYGEADEDDHYDEEDEGLDDFEDDERESRFALGWPDEERDDHGRWTSAGGGGTATDVVKYWNRDRDRPKFLKTAAKKWAAKLTGEETSGLEYYTGEDYYALNHSLRDWAAGGPEPPGADLARDIDSAIRKFPPHKEPVTSYRGLAVHDDAKLAGIETALQVALETGQPVAMNGFTSSSLDPYRAISFADEASEDDRPLLKIVSTRGAYIDPVSRTKGEHEILHTHGDRFKVTGVRDVEYHSLYGEVTTRRTYTLEAVPEPPPPLNLTARFYDDAEARDDHGRWSGAGGVATPPGAPDVYRPYGPEDARPYKQDRADAPHELRVRTGRWEDSLTPAEVDAVEDYTVMGFQRLNAGLAEAGGDPQKLGPDVRAYYDTMASALAKSPPLERPVTVWRGAALRVDRAADFLRACDAAAATGGTVQVPCFQSCSMSPHVALDAARSVGVYRDTRGIQRKDILLEIRARSGAWVGGSGFAAGDENEWLMSPAARFRSLGTREVAFTSESGATERLRVVQLEEVPPASFYDEKEARDAHGKWVSVEEDEARIQSAADLLGYEQKHDPHSLYNETDVRPYHEIYPGHIPAEFHERAKAWEASLSEGERRAVHEYVGGDFYSLNKALSTAGGDAEQLYPHVRDWHDRLAAAIAKFGPTDPPVTVWRGCDMPAARATEFLAACRAAAVTGDAVRVPCFQSCTFNPVLAAYKSQQDEVGDDEEYTHYTGVRRRGVLLEVRARSGAWIGGGSRRLIEENEWLLAPTARFKVLSVGKVPFADNPHRRAGGLRTVIRLEELPDATQASPNTVAHSETTPAARPSRPGAAHERVFDRVLFAAFAPDGRDRRADFGLFGFLRRPTVAEEPRDAHGRWTEGGAAAKPQAAEPEAAKPDAGASGPVSGRPGNAAEAEADYKKNGVRSASFKAWFGDWQADPASASKVLDPKSGEPLVVYHGSTHGVTTEFKPEWALSRSETHYYGPGFYFTEDKKAGEAFAEGAQGSSTKGKGGVGSYYLKSVKPFDADGDKIDPSLLTGVDRASVRAAVVQKALADEGRSEAMAAGRSFDAGEMKFGYKELTSNAGVGGFGVSKLALRDLLKKLGYDSITTVAPDAPGGTPGGNRFWVVFEPNQVKSDSNRGTFDPNSNDTRFSAEFEWDPEKHPHGEHGRWASTEGAAPATVPPPDRLGRVREEEVPADYMSACKAWAAGLSDADRAAVSLYTSAGDNYRAINTVMRDGPAADQPVAGWVKGERVNTTALAVATDLKQLLATAPVHAEPVTSYRGVRSKSPVRITQLEKAFQAALASGEPITLEGFSSASVNPLFASGWTPRNGFVLEMKSRRAPYVAGLSDNDHELEVLHNAGTSYKVTGVRKVTYTTGDWFDKEVRTTYTLEEIEPAAFYDPRGSQGDLDPDGRWRTISGNKVHITAEGEIDAGGHPALRQVLEEKAGLKPKATAGEKADNGRPDPTQSPEYRKKYREFIRDANLYMNPIREQMGHPLSEEETAQWKARVAAQETKLGRPLERAEVAAELAFPGENLHGRRLENFLHRGDPTAEPVAYQPGTHPLEAASAAVGGWVSGTKTDDDFKAAAPDVHREMHYALEKKGDAIRRFLPDVTAQDLAVLAGWQPGDDAPQVSTSGNDLTLHVYTKDSKLGSDHLTKLTRVTFTRTVKGVELDLGEFNVTKRLQGKGEATRAVTAMLATAARLGVWRARTGAVGCGPLSRENDNDGRKYKNGYYTWPMMGFDCEFDREGRKEYLDRLPEPYKNAHRLSDILMAPGGPQAWKTYGWGVSCDLKLNQPDTPGMRVLTNYLKAKADKRAAEAQK